MLDGRAFDLETNGDGRIGVAVSSDSRSFRSSEPRLAGVLCVNPQC
jgi:hypothetical protein